MSDNIGEDADKQNNNAYLLDQRDDTGSNTKLNTKNIVNALSYFFNVLITYGVGTGGWFGLPTNSELSEKYQTIITPNGKAFTIWAVIFIFQGIFSLVQLFPRYRNKRMVQDGVGYWYFFTCLAQAAWTISFANEVILLSLFCMFLIWGSLVALLYSQYYISDENTFLEFWLFRFPFSVHAGWITAASALNVSVVAVDSDTNSVEQLALGIVSLAVLHAVSLYVLFFPEKPNCTIAFVLAWANGFIYNELQNPKDLIVSTFSEESIEGVALAARAVAYIISIQILVRVAIFGLQKYRASHTTS